MQKCRINGARAPLSAATNTTYPVPFSQQLREPRGNRSKKANATARRGVKGVKGVKDKPWERTCATVTSRHSERSDLLLLSH
ncbi:hypothetical protein K0M31_013697 [Melipona bicolor]|uniref:Uncharacterized protein n=1 Tax=Melipona bicolor TaxID=60889 RepID=A0AA40FHQ9_9HYME|nr:hypothetical protein K0M31_013697 [Melipona bicolor]